MAYTNIDDPSAHFQTLVYTGNGSNPRNLTNDGNSDLKPDWIWNKNLTDAGTSHKAQISNLSMDAPTNSTQVSPNNSSNANSPATTYGYCSAFLTDGFTAAAGGTNGDAYNANNKEFVAWQWKCGGGSVSNNTDGNITTSVQTNLTAGISIGTYEGTSSNGKTIGHGLGAIPDFFMIKGYSGAGTKYWVIGAPNHPSFLNNASKHLFLDTDMAVANNTTMWGNVAFTSTTAPLNSHQAINHSNSNYMFFAFKSIQGYSKIVNYVGNGVVEGPFVYTGFKPAFIMIKNTSAVESWVIFDSKRSPSNIADKKISPNTTDAENNNSAIGGAGYNDIDILSNGFKIRKNNAATNGDGNSFLYMAFAEHPFVTSTGIPTTAR